MRTGRSNTRRLIRPQQLRHPHSHPRTLATSEAAAAEYCAAEAPDLEKALERATHEAADRLDTLFSQTSLRSPISGYLLGEIGLRHRSGISAEAQQLAREIAFSAPTGDERKAAAEDSFVAATDLQRQTTRHSSSETGLFSRSTRAGRTRRQHTLDSRPAAVSATTRGLREARRAGRRDPGRY